MADGGGHVGPVVGPYAAQFAVQDDPRVDLAGQVVTSAVLRWRFVIPG